MFHFYIERILLRCPILRHHHYFLILFLFLMTGHSVVICLCGRHQQPESVHPAIRISANLGAHHLDLIYLPIQPTIVPKVATKECLQAFTIFNFSGGRWNSFVAVGQSKKIWMHELLNCHRMFQKIIDYFYNPLNMIDKHWSTDSLRHKLFLVHSGKEKIVIE